MFTLLRAHHDELTAAMQQLCEAPAEGDCLIMAADALQQRASEMLKQVGRCYSDVLVLGRGCSALDLAPPTGTPWNRTVPHVQGQLQAEAPADDEAEQRHSLQCGPITLTRCVIWCDLLNGCHVRSCPDGQ